MQNHSRLYELQAARIAGLDEVQALGSSTVAQVIKRHHFECGICLQPDDRGLAAEEPYFADCLDRWAGADSDIIVYLRQSICLSGKPVVVCMLVPAGSVQRQRSRAEKSAVWSSAQA